MKKRQKLAITDDMHIFRVRATPGGLYCAYPADDHTNFAHGETPYLAIRNLCDDLAEEEARLDANLKADPS